MDKGLAKPISPITIFPISNVESAFRALQRGKIVGKIVVVPQPGDQVNAVPAKTKDLLRPDATYIIIGGTGGLGRSMSRWMIEKGALNIVLISRSGNTTGKVAELIDKAKIAGAAIVVRSCDVTDQAKVQKLVAKGMSSLPPVRGVIHSAMVLHIGIFLAGLPKLTKWST